MKKLGTEKNNVSFNVRNTFIFNSIINDLLGNMSAGYYSLRFDTRVKRFLNYSPFYTASIFNPRTEVSNLSLLLAILNLVSAAVSRFFRGSYKSHRAEFKPRSCTKTSNFRYPFMMSTREAGIFRSSCLSSIYSSGIYTITRLRTRNQ